MGNRSGLPSKPGWYPDPWSATVAPYPATAGLDSYFRFVQTQAVDLRDAGVGLERLNLDACARAELEQPRRSGGPDDETNISASCRDRIDHLDLTGGMAESMTGDVEHDGHNQELQIEDCRLKIEFQID